MFLSSQGNSQASTSYAMVYECPHYNGVITQPLELSEQEREREIMGGA